MKTDLVARCLVVVCLFLTPMLVSCSDRARSDAAGASEESEAAGKITAAEAAAHGGSAIARLRKETTLPAGSEITVRTTAGISTKSNQPGQSFSAVLEQPIVENDWVIAAKGALIGGIITECDPGGRLQGVAQLAVTLQRLTLADGRIIEIQTFPIRRQAQSTKGKDAQKIGIGAGIGAAVGAVAGGGKGAAIGAAVGGGAGSGVVLATHGEPAAIGSESKLTFTLKEPVTITE
jgi:hypothetical protein